MKRITFEDFKRIDLRIGKIVSAEKVRKARKLIVLKVDLGKEVRTLVAGLAGYYEPEELVGKEVIVVANLEPKTIMGIKSEGMLLAAIKDGEPVLVVPEREVPPGSKVS